LRVLTCCVLTLAAPCLQAENVRLSDVRRLANGEVELTISGVAKSPVVLQSSADLKSWQDLQTLTLSGGAASYIDTQAGSVRERSYRVRSGEVTQPVTLPDLGSLENRVFPAPEGFNTVQFAPNGSLGFIVWRDRDLIFRERDASGSWSEQVIDSGGNIFKPYLTFDFQAPREDYRFQPSTVLLYDSSSVPHIFKCAGKNIVHYRRDGSWSVAETIIDPLANADLAVIEAALGPNNTFHFAALSAGSPRNLTYGTNRNGQWNWTTVSTVTDPPLTYWAPPFAARWLAMDVDSHNAAHIKWLRDIGEMLGLDRNQLGKWALGSEPTHRFLKLLEEVYGSPDNNIGSGASFAIESWAGYGIGKGEEAEANNFWRELIVGLERFNQTNRKGLPPLNIGFFRFHFGLETGHVANVEHELAEVFMRRDFDRDKWMSGATRALDAILVFWKGLDESRRKLAT